MGTARPRTQQTKAGVGGFLQMISKMIAEKQKSQRLLHEVSLNDFASFGVLSWIVMAGEILQKKRKAKERVFNQGKNFPICPPPPPDRTPRPPSFLKYQRKK